MTSHMLGTGMRLTLMFQQEGSLYLAVGGDEAEATWATTSPQGLGQSGGTLCPPNLCRAGDRSSPSVMVSLVNTLIREVSGRVMARRWGGGGGTQHPHLWLHTTVPLGELPGWEEMP